MFNIFQTLCFPSYTQREKAKEKWIAFTTHVKRDADVLVKQMLENPRASLGD
jgi:hypothetical protein